MPSNPIVKSKIVTVDFKFFSKFVLSNLGPTAK